MPRPASRNFAFEPEQIRVMQWAFEAVCVKLQLAMGSEDRVTELVGDKIIELATAGERNPDRLTARVLAEFGIENDGSLWPHESRCAFLGAGVVANPLSQDRSDGRHVTHSPARPAPHRASLRRQMQTANV